MKILSFLSLVSTGLLLAGCNKETPPAKPEGSSASGNPITAPLDYIAAAGKAQKTAAKTISGVGLDQAVKMFYAQEGKFPKDLKELVPDYVGAIPPAPAGMKYDYDPKTGAVKVLPK